MWTKSKIFKTYLNEIGLHFRLAENASLRNNNRHTYNDKGNTSVSAPNIIEINPQPSVTFLIEQTIILEYVHQ